MARSTRSRSSRQVEAESRLFPPRPDSDEGRALLEGAAPSDYAAMLESQCGATDDSQPVEQYDGTLGVPVAFAAAHRGPVGQLQWNANLGAVYDAPGNVTGVRWATGAMISSDLFLTAGHNFDQTGNGWTRPRDNATGLTIPPAEIATNMHVNFNFQDDPAGNPRPEQEFPVVELVEWRLGNLDYAIVRLGGNPGLTFGIETVSTTDAAVGQTICIIGHPNGVPKRIEAGPVTDLHGSQIGYNDIDTLGGNSGSCLLRATDGQIVGVHVLGGCSITDPNSDASHNHGVRITSIRAVSPTLQTLTQPTGTILDALTTRPAVDFNTTVTADTLTLPQFDDPRTRKVLDDPFTLKSHDDPVTRKVLDDPGTRKVLDDPGTNPAFDSPQTSKFRDDFQTNPVADLVGTSKAVDDVKTAALDKGFTDTKIPGSDTFDPGFGGRVQPDPRGGLAGRFGGPQAQPFVMATPHHAPGAAGEGGDGESVEETILALAEAIEDSNAEMAQLMAAFRQALAAWAAGHR